MAQIYWKLIEKLLVIKSSPPAELVISYPNCTSPIVTLPNQPLLRIQFMMARMLTVPELVCEVLTKEMTSLAPLLPR